MHCNYKSTIHLPRYPATKPTLLCKTQYGRDYEFDAPVKLLDKLLHSMAQSADEQLVLVSQVLAANINVGYEEIVNTQVLTFNGKPVKNLKSLASMVESCNEEFLKFDLEYQQVLCVCVLISH